MANKIETLLRARYDGFTVSERMIASYLLDNLASVPFETAASIGERVGVSAMTVGRFLKALGYARLAALKDDLRAGLGDAPWLVQPAAGADLDARLKAETAAIAEVYRLATTPGWRTVVATLAGSDTVYVAGFQTERGLAMAFANHLDYVRPGVRLVDASAGTFGEVLTEATPADCLLLIDIRRYSRHFRQLAERAAARRVPLIVVTDPYCPWARDLTPHILAAEVSLGHFWDVNTALASLLNLLVDDVVRAIGEARVHVRLEALSGAYDAFVGFQGRASPAAVEPAGRGSPPPGRRKRAVSRPSPEEEGKITARRGPPRRP